MVLFFITLLIININIFQAKEVFAQEDFAYFSIAKNRDQYFIGLEGIFHEKNKILKLDDLNYEWTIFFEDTAKEFKTHKPLLSFVSEKNFISGKVSVYSDDLSFKKEFNFTYRYRAKPTVSIARYIENLNLVLPFGKIEKNEKLFPLIFNFSSKNLSFAWRVLNDTYYSLLFDPEGLPKDTEIRLTVTNINNPIEYDSDSVKIK